MKKLLPPYLFILFTISMAVVCWFTPVEHLVGTPYNYIGLAIAIAGLSLSVYAKNQFKKIQTNLLTFNKPNKIVIEGAFEYSRNPMYLGFVVAQFGFAILFGGSVTSLLLAGLFFVIVDRWYIQFEENIMSEQFGDEYISYCKNVRRWL